MKNINWKILDKSIYWYMSWVIPRTAIKVSNMFKENKISKSKRLAYRDELMHCLSLPPKKYRNEFDDIDDYKSALKDCYKLLS